MNESSAKFGLPVVNEPEPIDSAPAWEGFVPTGMPDLSQPMAPQGEYNDALPEMPLALPALDWNAASGTAELMSPAGSLDAAYAAFHYGADAIYLGLKKFSARAEAENFTLAELDEIVTYAHGLSPRRRVFVALNTLIRQDELEELIETLFALDEIGVDAVILQDLGVLHALQTHFPGIELHGSTQMAVHNQAGARAMRQLGLSRIVLARELTFEEVRDITQTAGIETEVFIHGALCYSYSGLCLFSAQTLGRSGNRGKCAYSCRDSFEISGAPKTLRDGSPVKRDPQQGFPFSMKDLALPDHLPALRAAGVSCVKIEGRKKSPLYVATTTDYYRRIMDGTLEAHDRPAIEADLKTVFSRPWTRLFVQSHLDKEVADRDTVGHRGSVIGTLEAVVGGSSKRIRFRTSRPLQVHDGLQIDLPTQGKPFGFAVEKLWLVETDRREVFTADAGTLVEVPLPGDYPNLPLGASIYCSSSQDVKQRYRFQKPRAAQPRHRLRLQVSVQMTSENVAIDARIIDRDGHVAAGAHKEYAGEYAPARDANRALQSLRDSFARLGDSAYVLDSLEVDEPRFVPISQLNRMRRDIVAELEARHEDQRQARLKSLMSELLPRTLQPASVETFRWSIKVDRIGYVDAFEPEDFDGIDEIIVDITRDHPRLLQEKLAQLAGAIGQERIRLALPALTRKWEEKGLLHKISALRSAGWTRWEAGNVSAWTFLELDPRPANKPVNGPPIDLATDWSLYVVNRLAAEKVLAMGASWFALSPEDGFNNWRSLLAEYPRQAVLIVYQDTPLFLAESCAYANLIGGCPGKANCKFESMEMVSTHGEKVTAIDYHCRTIVVNQGPFCLSPHLQELARAGAANLRADFVYRPYDPAEVRTRWRQVRAGEKIPRSHCANWKRGLL